MPFPAAVKCGQVLVRWANVFVLASSGLRVQSRGFARGQELHCAALVSIQIWRAVVGLLRVAVVLALTFFLQVCNWDFRMFASRISI
jgi:hypothetical protein